MQQVAYTAHTIYQWEQRWFADGNSSYGLMQQAALLMSHHIHALIQSSSSVNVWCGAGNNGGDGLLIAKYLHQAGHQVHIILPNPPTSLDAKRALMDCGFMGTDRLISDISTGIPAAHVQIDALFGIGLNRVLNDDYQRIIHQFNHQQGLKISIDIPSGLHADTGVALPVCIKSDHTLCLIGLKIGLYGAVGKSVSGQITLLPLIPPYEQTSPIATVISTPPTLPKKDTNAHKGDFGSVLVIGGHAKMGGAVILAGEAAMAVGAGRVTVMTHPAHHTAILSRSPNLMLSDINDDAELDKLPQMTTVCFGMGLGRDAWSRQVFERIFARLLHDMADKAVVLDADALWHLANRSLTDKLPSAWLLTTHSAEAGRLLGVSTEQIEQNRFSAICELHHRYGGSWVLKGANTLVLANDTLSICTLGNAGMATAGMGDVLSGMLAGLFAQLDISPMTAVALHAHAGDLLARRGERGLVAHQMMDAIKMAVNGGNDS